MHCLQSFTYSMVEDCQELFLENVESERQMPVTLYSAVVVLVV